MHNGVVYNSKSMLQLEISEADLKVVNYERIQNHSALVRKRMNVLWLKHEGYWHQDIAFASGVHRNTVTNVLQTYNSAGLNRLLRTGNHNPQSELMRYKQTISASFEQQPPSTVNQAANRIEELTGLRRGPTQVRHFMQSIGMRFRKAGQIPAKADPGQQARFLRYRLKSLITRATKDNCYLYFVDAAHFTYGPFLAALWCFTRIFVKAPSGRQRHNILAAFDPVNHVIERVVNQDYINAESVVTLLKKLKARNHKKPVHLVLDNAKYQRCKLVQQTARKLGIRLVFLPTYSPNVNLIERLWRFIKKKALYGKYYPTFMDFRNAIDKCVEDIENGAYENELKSLITANFQQFQFAQSMTA